MTKLVDLLVQLIAGLWLKISSRSKAKMMAKADVDREVYDTLQLIQRLTQADSVYLAMFHNGGKDANGVSFDRYSITHEWAPFSKRFLPSGQSIPISAYPDYFAPLLRDGHYFNLDFATGEKKDEIYRAVMQYDGVAGVYTLLLHTANGAPLGFLCIVYSQAQDDSKFPVDIVRGRVRIIEAKLNMMRLQISQYVLSSTHIVIFFTAFKNLMFLR